jgi:hypothetical protein
MTLHAGSQRGCDEPTPNLGQQVVEKGIWVLLTELAQYGLSLLKNSCPRVARSLNYPKICFPSWFPRLGRGRPRDRLRQVPPVVRRRCPRGLCWLIAQEAHVPLLMYHRELLRNEHHVLVAKSSNQGIIGDCQIN